VSAIQQHRSGINRAGELRTNQATLDLLWQKAKIIQIADGRIASRNEKLSFSTCSEIKAAATSGKFSEGFRIFLGLDLSDNTPYFAWDTTWEGEISDEEKAVGFTTLREVGAQLPPLEFELALHAIAFAHIPGAHVAVELPV